MYSMPKQTQFIILKNNYNILSINKSWFILIVVITNKIRYIVLFLNTSIKHMYERKSVKTYNVFEHKIYFSIKICNIMVTSYF